MIYFDHMKEIKFRARYEPTGEWHMLPFDCHSGRPLEIIGNIYENPELINHLEDTIQAA
jgi:hypothetical protein